MNKQGGLCKAGGRGGGRKFEAGGAMDNVRHRWGTQTQTREQHLVAAAPALIRRAPHILPEDKKFDVAVHAQGGCMPLLSAAWEAVLPTRTNFAPTISFGSKSQLRAASLCATSRVNIINSMAYGRRKQWLKSYSSTRVPTHWWSAVHRIETPPGFDRRVGIWPQGHTEESVR